MEISAKKIASYKCEIIVLFVIIIVTNVDTIFVLMKHLLIFWKV
jgi:hypothetical protein